jgi:GNAT superfamily N-acetyltransferase
MNVRKATEDDVGEIVDMSAMFYKTTAYQKVGNMCRETVAKLTRWLIDTGVMLVAEDHRGCLIGMVGLAIVPGMFNAEIRGAHEVVWYVDPDEQRSGVGTELLKAIEPACRERGADAIWMMHLANSPPKAGEAYIRMGFEMSEVCYMKGL